MSSYSTQIYYWLEENAQGHTAAPLFAVLDGARDESIHRLAKQFEGEMRCLYRGTLPADIAEVAPYLLRLTYDSRGMRRIVDRMWGKQWGILIKARTSIDEIRHHLRRFILVKDQNWQQYYLRFYDPRILRPFLKACNTQELKNFFGPIQEFIIESYTPDKFEVYSLENGTLKVGIHTLIEDSAETV